MFTRMFQRPFFSWVKFVRPIRIGRIACTYVQIVIYAVRGPNLSPYRTVPVLFCSRTVLYPYRTVPVPFNLSWLFFVLGSVKRTEPLILTVRFSVWPRTVAHQNGDRYPFIIEVRESYSAKMGTIIHLYLRTTNHTASILVRCIDKRCKLLRSAVLKYKRITVPLLVRCGSRFSILKG